jgi:site-specific DNA-methyltransferase (adenine-specific)
LSFMGKDWDHGVPGEAFWREALRVAKPGAYLVAFGGTRTYHRLTCAIEDAGWEIRDCLSWLYGSGFPKSKNVSLAIDKGEGHPNRGRAIPTASRFQNASDTELTSNPVAAYEAKTDLARKWQGWGTALKPAWEPIILARKPLMGTVASNVAQYGTGGINVDGCRIGTDIITTQGGDKFPKIYGKYATCPESTHSGRWPANVCLDEDAAGMFPESRFFYTSKASRREREAGLEGMPEREYPVAVIQTQGVGLAGESLNGKQVARSRNHHPTVKPIALMRWLCRLVTPKGGLILDPFTGSGTTGCAAVLEGFRFVGVEREPEYAAIAEKRIAHWAAQTPDADLFTEAL